MSTTNSHSWQEIAISSAGHECWFFTNFHHMKIKTVYSVLITIATIGHPYTVISKFNKENIIREQLMGWLFVASVLSIYLIRQSFVTVFRYSNNRIVLSALCLNYSHINGLSVIQYLCNQSLFLFHNIVPLSLLTVKSAIFLSCQQSVSW